MHVRTCAVGITHCEYTVVAGTLNVKAISKLLKTVLIYSAVRLICFMFLMISQMYIITYNTGIVMNAREALNLTSLERSS